VALEILIATKLCSLEDGCFISSNGSIGDLEDNKAIARKFGFWYIFQELIGQIPQKKSGGKRK
jgi:hypothetical protein